MKHSKIAIIGAGAVGTTTAYALILQSITAEIILVDINETRCNGEILDLSDALPFGNNSFIKSGKIKDASQADIIVIAAGARQKPGQSRLELIDTNQQVLMSILNKLQPINPSAILIMVTNPVDIIALCAQEYSGLPKKQVFGSGTFLDSMRLRELISQKINIAEQSIHAYILGEHGDSQFAAWSCAQVGGIPLLEYLGLNKKELDIIEQTTRDKAYEIIKCKGSTFFGIATCVAAICRIIIFNEKRVIPVSCFIEKFGISLSMPTILGENGIEKILSIPLNTEEQTKLESSAQKLKDIREQCRIQHFLDLPVVGI